MKILINRKPVEGPWGGGNLLVKALSRNIPEEGHELVYSLQPGIDVILMLDPRPGNTGISVNEILLYKNSFPDTKILHRVNECDARKGTNDIDSLLRACSQHTDKTIFVSEWMRQYHIERGWACSSSSVIINGVDRDHFRPNNKIENGKINIVTHHWSNNLLKGFDFYEMIDNFVADSPSYTFTYIGRDRGTFKNTNVIAPLFGKELGEELGRYDLYISGTRHDPGPNHILESLSCKIPTYTFVDGGGAVEFVGQDHTFKSWESLYRILESKKFKPNSMSPVSWDECIKKYIEEILNTEDK